ncbi:MAG: hypothetical protein DRG76_01955 [Deltaproteobacteria bacterium]|nr:MAG: hypothetical protein DRG76_01955 [Deltaproteobacteria bacterium]
MGDTTFIDDPSLVLEFIAEALEHLDGIDNNLFQYEKNPNDTELIDSIFRAIHSVKGASGFLGLQDINKLAHRLETLLDQLRKEERTPDNETMDVLFSGCDLLRTLIEEVSKAVDEEIGIRIEADDKCLEDVMSALNHLIGGSSMEGNSKKRAIKKSTPKPRDTGGYDISDKMLKDFQIEALEHLETCDAALIDLDKKHDDREAINDLFRAIHTIKGTSAYLRQKTISKLSHTFESMLELLRRRKDLRLTDSMLDLAFQTIDCLKAMINDLENEESKESALKLIKEIILEREKLERKDGSDSSDEAEEFSSIDPISIFKDAATQHLETIKTCIDRAEEKSSLDKNVLDIIFRAVHSLKSSAAYMGFDHIEKDIAVFEDLLGDIRKGDLPFGPAIVDMTKDTVGTIEKQLQKLDLPHNNTDFQVKEYATGDESKGVSEEGSSDAEVEKQQVRSATAFSVSQVSPKTMRIDQRLLDVFMNLVGELIVSRNALGHVERQLKQEDVPLSEVLKGLQKATQTITRISDEMQRNVMEMRMVPVRNVFQKFPRMVRDISRKTGKKVDLILQGEDTEIDKGIAEDIGDPLVHIIRNCVDHGIEMPHVRVKTGKPETGTIILKAYHEGNFIIIDIIDDGAGIDPIAVANKAIENGMITQERASQMSKEEIFNLIFMPGFSTAQEVTDISGRGVGMDVVRTNLAKLKGNVRIASEVGQGTHVRLEVPLTLALVEAMLVGAGSDIYAIPVEAITETVKITTPEIKSLMKKKAITHRGKVIGLEFLSHLLNISQNGHKMDHDEQMPVLIVQAANDCLGIVVDKLYRKEEIVIKPLADYLAGLPGIAGASILGDGKTILILEPNELVSMATRN